ncbi:MAG: hypothetical protein HKN87_06430 [Saprospiraceae bacterium]|nr:hypothetical protein [Saprospiraceae bacterium]
MTNCLLSLLVLCISYAASGQVLGSERIDISVTLPEVSILDLAPNTSTIELSLSAPSQAGDPIDMGNTLNSTKWINYSSSIRKGGPRKSITAQVLSGELPRGLRLKLSTGKYTGSGRGKTGKPRKEIELSHLPRTIIKNIGAAYTGSGMHQGHNITFSLVYDEYRDIDFGTSTMVIAFTLTDN